MRPQGEQPNGKAWHGVRAGVLIAASTSLLTLAVFAAVAKVVSQDHGWLSGSHAPSARVAQVHDLTGQNPLRSAEDESNIPMTRVASAHDAVMQSPWKKIANDMADAILPGYRQGRHSDSSRGVAKTKLVEFDAAPFPYDGPVTGARRMALASEDGEKSRGSARGRLFRQKDAYRDRRVLLHIPKSFDPGRPAVMVVFFHGHRATLSRDVLNRQQVAAQISGAGVNAVLVAPQFAVAASDSSPGNLGEPGGLKRFVDEAGKKLAQLHGSSVSARSFSNMPVVIVAYSGGYLAAAWGLHHGGVKDRVRGVVLLDALYGDLDKFAAWIAGNKSTFFISSYTSSTRRRNSELMQMLQERDVSYVTEMSPRNRRDNVFFLATASDVNHTDFVTRAWAVNPIADVLQKQAGRLMGSSPIARSPGAAALR